VYERLANELRPKADEELARPIDRRSKEAGVHLLDYASACLACGQPTEAQRALYEAIVITNDLALDDASGNASLIFAESLKVWQGEAYERATIELLHGVSLMQLGDFDNARVAFDRAIYTDRFSKGAVAGYEGRPDGKGASFDPNETYSSRGGSVYQRDFLAAYVLRTLCYIHEGRPTRARASFEEFKDVYDDLRAAAAAAPAQPSATTWTRADGRYGYPTAFVPPFGPSAPNSVFDASFEELRRANLLVVAGTGCRPRKVKTGEMGYRKAHLVHDAYLPPSEPVHRVDLQIDGGYLGAMSQGLNLFGQAAGRGPSAKDIAQQQKANVENIGEILEAHGVYGIQYIGLLIQALNEEEADVRQWGLLPNAIHVWVGRVDPGPHVLTILATGANTPVREEGWAQFFAPAIQSLEHLYLTWWDLESRNVGGAPVAARHTLVMPITVSTEGLTTLFAAERFNANVSLVADPEPRRYVLQPRRTPESRD